MMESDEFRSAGYFGWNRHIGKPDRIQKVLNPPLLLLARVDLSASFIANCEIGSTAQRERICHHLVGQYRQECERIGKVK